MIVSGLFWPSESFSEGSSSPVPLPLPSSSSSSTTPWPFSLPPAVETQYQQFAKEYSKYKNTRTLHWWPLLGKVKLTLQWGGPSATDGEEGDALVEVD